MRVQFFASKEVRSVLSLLSFSVLIGLTTALLQACGQSGSDNAASTEPDLAASPWCTSIINPNSHVRELERLQFNSDGSLAVTRFHLNAKQTRGTQFGSDSGRWSLNGNSLSAVLNSSSSEGERRLEATVKVSAASSSNKAELRVTLAGAQGAISYEACN